MEGIDMEVWREKERKTFPSLRLIISLYPYQLFLSYNFERYWLLRL